MRNIKARVWLLLVRLAMAMGLLLFVSAGTVGYWQAWVFLSIYFGVSGFMTRDLLHKDPALLARRLSGGPWAEKRPVQRFIMLCTSIAFLALLVVPALDRRYGWSAVPTGAVTAGNALIVIGLYIIFRVYRVNTYSSATIEIIEGQKVISTGPYAVVRHPMYAAGVLYILGTPLALGSYWGLIPFAAMLPLVIWRLLDEEYFLDRNLPGYTDYRQRVRYRLVPYVW